MLAVRLLADIGLRGCPRRSTTRPPPWTRSTRPRACSARWRAGSPTSATSRTAPRCPGSALCRPPGSTTCAPESRPAAPAARIPNGAGAPATTAHHNCSRCPRRRGTPRSSGSASRSRARLGACRPKPTQQDLREPRAPREPEQTVPKGTRDLLARLRPQMDSIAVRPSSVLAAMTVEAVHRPGTGDPHEAFALARCLAGQRRLRKLSSPQRRLPRGSSPPTEPP